MVRPHRSHALEGPDRVSVRPKNAMHTTDSSATATGSMVVGGATGAASNGASSSKGSTPIGAIVGGVVVSRFLMPWLTVRRAVLWPLRRLLPPSFSGKSVPRRPRSKCAAVSPPTRLTNPSGHPSSGMIDPESFMTTPFVGKYSSAHRRPSDTQTTTTSREAVSARPSMT